MSRGSEGSLKTVRKGDGGGGWKASPDLTVSLPTVRETVITPFLQLLSHLPWPIEWSLPDSLPTAQDGGRGVDGSGPATLINHCHSVLFIFVFIPIPIAFLSPPCFSPGEDKSPDMV